MRQLTPCFEKQRNADTFTLLFDSFINEMGTANSWSKATYSKLLNLKHHVVEYDGDVCLEIIDETWLIGFVEYCLDQEMCNTTIQNLLCMLRWFMNWALKHHHVRQTEWMSFKPKLKTVRGKIVFLTWDELMRVTNLEFGSDEQQLEYVRDLFCLECFTGLRYSDIQGLKPCQISDSTIEIVTKKTADHLSIELNTYSRWLLEKYRGRWADHVMPQVTIQWMNRRIKEVCRRAGVTEVLQKVWYEGSERYEVSKAKWELVSSHCGRRTFVCNSLAMGITPETVMKWTGHSSYKSMKPYIDVADDVKRAAMHKWDER